MKLLKRTIILSFLLLMPGCKQTAGGLHGYVEGEFVMIAPTTAGLLQSLSVERGDTVQAGATLFSMDTTTLQAARDAAEAAVEQAQAQWNDLTKGERPEEIEVLLKQKEQAEAALSNAEKEFKRIKPLAKTGAASQSSLDDAKTALDTATARVQELEARLKTSELGGRIDQLDAAKAAVSIAELNLVQAEKRLTEAKPAAPTDAQVEDVYYRPGEFVQAGTPVIKLLPPKNIKIRFFVSQAMMPTLQTGQSIQINCDGCSGPVGAKISFVATQAEYTPPVIYSVESRDKLVFMVEAEPDSFSPQLRPGLPVDISW